MKKLLLVLLTIAGLATVPGCRRDYCDTCEDYECPEPSCPDRCGYEVEHDYGQLPCAGGSCASGTCPVKEYYDPAMNETVKIKETKPKQVAPSTTKATTQVQKTATPAQKVAAPIQQKVATTTTATTQAMK